MIRKYNNKRSYGRRRSSMTSVETYEGETIEQKVQRLVQNKEPIKDGAPEIFTERKDGIHAAYNIRTDRFELAADAMDKVTGSVLAARDQKGKVIELPNNEGDAQSTQGE